jgi:hypothetical protein
MGMPASNASGSSPFDVNRRQVIAISTLAIAGAAAPHRRQPKQILRFRNPKKRSIKSSRFDLGDQGASTRLVFDHTGFPKGLAGHLASGWQEHYGDPLSKLLN